MRIRYFKALGMALAMFTALVIAGCGSTGSTPGVGVAPTDTATTGPTATSAPTTLLPIHTMQVTISGQAQTILTAANGLTLYYRTIDSSSGVCSGGCAGTWPPIIAGSGAPTSTTTLPGKLATVQDANGAQVTYNGHPLYIYAGDSNPGDINGEGVGNIWFAVTVNVAKVTIGDATGPTPTPYSYYGH